MSNKCPDCGATELEICFCSLINDAFEELDLGILYPEEKKKKCTCGGAVAKTTHSDWCDVYPGR